MMLLALAAAVLLPPQTAQGLRCVAILALDRVGTQADDAAYYTAIIGAEAMDATGQSRETVRDLILAQVARVRATPPASTERSQCVREMKARVALERATSK